MRLAHLALLVSALLCGTSGSASAFEAADSAQAGAVPTAPATPTLPRLDSVRVLGVFRAGTRPNPGRTDTTRAGIGDIILLRVRNLQDLTHHAECRSRELQPVPGCQKQDLSLFLDGREIKGILPESGAPLADEGLLQFHLQRSLESDEAWADLLGGPRLGRGKFYVRPTEVSVGFRNGYALPSDVGPSRFQLIRIHKPWFIGCMAVALVVLWLLLRLARRSDLLRDLGDSPTGTDERGRVKRKPFSLARLQMAVWFYLVIAAFLFIWLITGASDIITTSTLALIGIGAGTALGAAALDTGTRQNNRTELETLRAESTALTQEVQELGRQIAAAPANEAELRQTRDAKRARIALAGKRIQVLEQAMAPRVSRGLVIDLLTDSQGGGISFHRFQMLVWTLVLSILFVHSVWYRLSMPEFSGTLLALMGISSGTYLGFKIPEQQA